MPLYCYRCLDCGSWDRRVAGIDDGTALCTRCKGLMLRVDDNILKPYFTESAGFLEDALLLDNIWEMRRQS